MWWLFVFSCVFAKLNVLVTKHFEPSVVVVGKPLKVTYSIYNVGESSIQDVQFVETSFKESLFTRISDSFEAQVDSVGPRDKATWSLTVEAKNATVFHDLPVDVSFEWNGEIRHVLSSSFGPLSILNPVDYHSKYAEHSTEWMYFFLLSFGMVMVPYAIKESI